MTTTPRRRRLLLGLTVAAAALAVTLLVGEIGLRLFLRRLFDTATLQQQLANVSIKSLIDYTADQQVVYVLRPNLQARFQESDVFTDGNGVRVGKQPAPEPADALRIALVGDSTPFGWRVQYEDTYGERLRAALAATAGRPIVLRNYSVPGYNAGQEFHAFKKTLAAFKPDLLIVHHDHNDAQPTGYGYSSWIPPEYGDNALHSALIKTVLRQLRRLHGNDESMLDKQHNQYIGDYCTTGPLYDAMQASRRELAELAKSNGFPALLIVYNSTVVSSPKWQQDEVYTRLHQPLTAAGRAMGYEVFDVYPALQAVLSDKQWPDNSRFWVEAQANDHHPTAAGHALLAEQLLAFIAATPALAKIFARK